MTDRQPGIPLRLRIAAQDAAYDLSYAFGSGLWTALLTDADDGVLASEFTHQFTGTVIGPYAVSACR